MNEALVIQASLRGGLKGQLIIMNPLLGLTDEERGKLLQIPVLD
jgi:hypothetical protein